MRSLVCVFTIFLFPLTCFASNEYVDNNLVTLALESIPAYGSSPGVGAKRTSCTLCHNTETGGIGNINASFGRDFQQAAQRLGVANNGAGLQATGPLSLATIFADDDFADLDSDRDNVSNGEEFFADTDPAGDIGNGDSSSGGGGGCGRIAGGGPMGGASLLLLIPFFFAFRPLNQREQT